METLPVPAPTPELLILLADLEVKRERHGNDWCKKHGVGARRLMLDRALPPNVTDINLFRSPESAQRYLAAHKEARATLSAHCRMCGGCKFARE